MAGKNPKAPGIFIKIITFTSVCMIIIIFSLFSMFIHWDFITYPPTPKLKFVEGEGFFKPKLSIWKYLQKGYDILSLGFMFLNGILILYRYYVVFFSDPGRFTLEKNLEIKHKPEKEEEIKEFSRNIYKDIIRVKTALDDFDNREMHIAEMHNPLEFIEGENKADITYKVLKRTFLHL